MQEKSLVIGCPKLDDVDFYIDKLTELIKTSNIKTITLVNMEVPCCFGLQRIVEEAAKKSGRVLPVRQTVITIRGQESNKRMRGAEVERQRALNDAFPPQLSHLF